MRPFLGHGTLCRAQRKDALAPAQRKRRAGAPEALALTWRASLSQKACLSPQHMQQRSCQFMAAVDLCCTYQFNSAKRTTPGADLHPCTTRAQSAVSAISAASTAALAALDVLPRCPCLSRATHSKRLYCTPGILTRKVLGPSEKVFSRCVFVAGRSLQFVQDRLPTDLRCGDSLRQTFAAEC